MRKYVVVERKLTVCAVFSLFNEGWAHFLQHLRVQLKRNITLILHVLVYYVKEKFFCVFINSGLYHWADPRQSRHRPKSKTRELVEELPRHGLHFH